MKTEHFNSEVHEYVATCLRY